MLERKHALQNKCLVMGWGWGWAAQTGFGSRQRRCFASPQLRPDLLWGQTSRLRNGYWH